MKVLTANRLSDGKVIYAGPEGRPVETYAKAVRFADEGAAAGELDRASRAPEVFVNPYLVEVSEAGPSGRDRLKETIRSSGPTVGHSLDVL